MYGIFEVTLKNMIHPLEDLTYVGSGCAIKKKNILYNKLFLMLIKKRVTTILYFGKLFWTTEVSMASKSYNQLKF